MPLIAQEHEELEDSWESFLGVSPCGCSAENGEGEKDIVEWSCSMGCKEIKWWKSLGYGLETFGYGLVRIMLENILGGREGEGGRRLRRERKRWCVDLCS